MKAFTLLELVVVIGLIMLISVIVIPASINQVRTSTLDSRISELSSNLFSYQQNAYSGLSNKNFGIKFNAGSYTLFVGNTFASAESTQTITLDNGITIGSINFANGSSEIDFVKNSLKPNTTGTINMTDIDTNSTYQLKINQEGYVEYYKI